MKNPGSKRPSIRHAPKKLITTLGDLIAAAYEAVDGFGPQRAEAAKALLTRSPLARSIHPHVRFVR
jgi:hypothetical protein